MADETNSDVLQIIVDVDGTENSIKNLNKFNRQLARAGRNAEEQMQVLENALQIFKSGLGGSVTRGNAISANFYRKAIEQVDALIDRLKKLKTAGSEIRISPQADESVLRGKELYRIEKGDKTRIVTQELAEGFKITRTYISDANGELDLFSKKIQKITKRNIFADFGKNAINKIGSLVKGRSFNRVASIIGYRLVRTVLSAFTRSIKSGLTMLGQDDKATKGLLTQFSAIGTSISVSLATTLIPILQSLGQALEPLSNNFIDFANALSLSNAQLQGQSEYFRISKDKINEYAKSLKNANGQLSQLDKFATLTGGKSVDIGDMVSTDGLNEATKIDTANIENFKNVINSITKIGEVTKGLIDTISSLDSTSSGFLIGTISALGLLTGAINPILGLLSSFALMMASTSPQAKILAGAVMTLSGAMLALGIAKTFAGNAGLGLKGTLIAIGAGAAVGAAMAAATSAWSSNIDVGSASSSAYTSTAAASQLRGASAGTATTSETIGSGRQQQQYISGDVYLDGAKVGKIITPQVYNTGVKAGYFGQKK